MNVYVISDNHYSVSYLVISKAELKVQIINKPKICILSDRKLYYSNKAIHKFNLKINKKQLRQVGFSGSRVANSRNSL